MPKGLVQTILDDEALARLQRDAKNEGLSMAAYLRRLILSEHQRTRVAKLERRVEKLEKLGERGGK